MKKEQKIKQQPEDLSEVEDLELLKEVGRLLSLPGGLTKKVREECKRINDELKRRNADEEAWREKARKEFGKKK